MVAAVGRRGRRAVPGAGHHVAGVVGLADVLVGAGAQAAHPVLDLGLAGEHEHGGGAVAADRRAARGAGRRRRRRAAARRARSTSTPAPVEGLPGLGRPWRTAIGRSRRPRTPLQVHPDGQAVVDDQHRGWSSTAAPRGARRDRRAAGRSRRAAAPRRPRRAAPPRAACRTRRSSPRPARRSAPPARRIASSPAAPSRPMPGEQAAGRGAGTSQGHRLEQDVDRRAAGVPLRVRRSGAAARPGRSGAGPAGAIVTRPAAATGSPSRAHADRAAGLPGEPVGERGRRTPGRCAARAGSAREAGRQRAEQLDERAGPAGRGADATRRVSSPRRRPAAARRSRCGRRCASAVSLARGWVITATRETSRTATRSRRSHSASVRRRGACPARRRRRRRGRRRW